MLTAHHMSCSHIQEVTISHGWDCGKKKKKEEANIISKSKTVADYRLPGSEKALTKYLLNVALR